MADALEATTHLVVSAAPSPPPPPRFAWSPSPVNGGGSAVEAGRDLGSSPAKRGVRRTGEASASPREGTAEGGGGGGLERNISADPLLRLLPDLRSAMPSLHWVGYLSTVGVYGNHDGAWVDEESELRPKTARATARVDAERDWLAVAAGANVPVAVLRLAGIYGPGRNALANLERGTAKRTVKPGQVFNRIHVADIAGALAFLGGREMGGVFNVTDDEPGPPQDVVTYAASLMGVVPPREVPYGEVEMTPMARSFWSDNKRVSNAKLKAAGYRFRFPDHRGALEAMWRDGSWRGDGSGGTGGE
ncbi:MAG: DUF1731 domain-containing protein [Rhizobiaceae bacterium]|nr:DUF1731 domain-containing protein [Rhizobiaceae bacterium]